MLTSELVPAAEQNSRRLMVVLHGLGDSLEGYRWLPPTLGLPWMNYLLVNAPDPYYGGYSWHDFLENPRPGIERSRRLLIELLDHQRDAGFPTEETVMFGFSQGCLMTLDVGLRYPHRFAGLVGISGFVFEPGELLAQLSPVARQQRLLMTHGTIDPMLPIEGTRESVGRLRAAGLNLEWHEFRKPHTIDDGAEIRLIREFVCASYPKRVD